DWMEKLGEFRHFTIEEAVNEFELLRRRQPRVGELADITPIVRLRIRIAHAGGDGHRARGEKAEQPGARAAARDLVRASLKITLQHRAPLRAQRGLRREAGEHRLDPEYP